MQFTLDVLPHQEMYFEEVNELDRLLAVIIPRSEDGRFHRLTVLWVQKLKEKKPKGSSNGQGMLLHDHVEGVICRLHREQKLSRVPSTVEEFVADYLRKILIASKQPCPHTIKELAEKEYTTKGFYMVRGQVNDTKNDIRPSFISKRGLMERRVTYQGRKMKLCDLIRDPHPSLLWEIIMNPDSEIVVERENSGEIQLIFKG
jgi:hypothetical protein